MLLGHHFGVNFLACISASEGTGVLPFLISLSPVVSFNRKSAFFVTCKQKYNFGGHNFSTSHCYLKKRDHEECLRYAGSFPVPTEISHLLSPFLFISLYLFLQGLPTPYCSPLSPLPSTIPPPHRIGLCGFPSTSAFIVYPAPLLGVVLPLHPCLSGFTQSGSSHGPGAAPPPLILALRALFVPVLWGFTCCLKLQLHLFASCLSF